mmetsp:Transcript_29020/g.67281  ORF Transcript_29020/g.67281 Transcript_29020/m.67281 type:complete len:222 (+) Transcript_29020:630-1295(+)
MRVTHSEQVLQRAGIVWGRGWRERVLGAARRWKVRCGGLRRRLRVHQNVELRHQCLVGQSRLQGRLRRCRAWCGLAAALSGFWGRQDGLDWSGASMNGDRTALALLLGAHDDLRVGNDERAETRENLLGWDAGAHQLSSARAVEELGAQFLAEPKDQRVVAVVASHGHLWLGLDVCLENGLESRDIEAHADFGHARMKRGHGHHLELIDMAEPLALKLVEL